MTFRLINTQNEGPLGFLSPVHTESSYVRYSNHYGPAQFSSPTMQYSYSPIKHQSSNRDLNPSNSPLKLNRMTSMKTLNDSLQTDTTLRDYRDNIHPYATPGYQNKKAIRVINPGEMYVKNQLPTMDSPTQKIHRPTQPLNRGLEIKSPQNMINNPFAASPKPVFKPIPSPQYLRAIIKEDEKNKKIVGAVVRQNTIIGRLADRMGEDSIYRLQNQKYDLGDRLRMLEMEHSFKQEQHSRMLREKLELQRERSLQTDRVAQSKRRETKNSGMVDILSKMLIANEFGNGNANQFSPNRDNSGYNHENHSNSPRKKKSTLPPIKSKKNKTKRRATKIYKKNDSEDDDEDDDDDDNELDDEDEDDDSSQDDSYYRKGKSKGKGKNGKNNGREEISPKAKKETVEKKSKRDRVLKNLRWVLWTMTYAQVLFGDVRHKVENRKREIHNQMAELIQVNFNTAIEFILRYAEPEIIKLVSNPKSSELYVPGRPLHPKEFEVRAVAIVENYKRLFDKICSATKEQNFDPNFLRFLAFISEDGGIPPTGFMFDFEIKRFMFSHYATLKNMTTVMSKMVIGCFLLLRVLLHKLIMRPWEYTNSISEKRTTKASRLSIGSLLYHTVLDLFRSSVPTHKDNQVFLPLDLRLKPSQTQLTAIDLKDDDEEDQPESKSKEPEPINGFYTKDLVLPFFKNKKNEELRKVIEGWLEQMYQLTHDIYSRASKEEKETLGLPI